ncbi:hypothetical protein KY330_05570 [Candidatus Woesearchaeota archaeon]|nr:hypothetical protein [Candidatus Woesearchaeota archaeon]
MIAASKVHKCPECGDKNFFVNKERGEVICKNCSFVVEDAMMDFGRERICDSEDFEKKSRSGAPFDPRVANNLITSVGNKDDLRKLPRSQRYLFTRIRKKNNWTSSSLEQNLNNSLTNLKLISSNLKVTEHIEKEAARIYRTAVEKGLTKARSNELIVIGCLYAVCRKEGFPKTLKEFSEVTGYTRKQIGKIYRFLIRALKINIQPGNAVDFVAKFSSELKLDAKVQTKAIKMIEQIQKLGLTSGKCPMSIAGTTLYLAGLLVNQKRTQKEISEVSNITEVTLRNRCKEFIKALKLEKKFKGIIVF